MSSSSSQIKQKVIVYGTGVTGSVGTGVGAVRSDAKDSDRRRALDAASTGTGASDVAVAGAQAAAKHGGDRVAGRVLQQAGKATGRGSAAVELARCADTFTPGTSNCKRATVCLGAAGSTAAQIPHPKARIAGTVVSMAATGAEMLCPK